MHLLRMRVPVGVGRETVFAIIAFYLSLKPELPVMILPLMPLPVLGRQELHPARLANVHGGHFLVFGIDMT